MLYDPERHEPLSDVAWDEQRARQAIHSILTAADERFSEHNGWPWHPLDLEPTDDRTQPALPMYHGAAGVIWTLMYLSRIAGIDCTRYVRFLPELLTRSRDWLATLPGDERASYLLGDTPILMMMQDQEDVLAERIGRNRTHPARELMWGSPGTMLAARLLFERTADSRWTRLFCESAATLREELHWSEEYRCHYWTQDLYGRTSTYLDAVHGFIGTAAVLIKGRDLLAPSQWREWRDLIVETVLRTATREEGAANWRPQLLEGTDATPTLMQFCHGAPGFVICLAELPDPRIDDVLLEAGEAIWRAGPLRKGNNLCHGTGGNGYAFLKLFERTADRRWLDCARRFAMHGIEQLERDHRQYGQLRYSLWTGDLGFAVYLYDCLRARAQFPTLDLFWPE